MSKYLLDTLMVSAYLLSRPATVTLVTPWALSGEAATSILVYGEVNEYIRGRSDYPQIHAQLLELLKEIPPVFVTHPIMRRYGEIRRTLRRTNSLIGDIDTLIAATALEGNLTLVTADGDFQRVPGLQLMLIPRSQIGR